jgi:hypothetical protein
MAARCPEKSTAVLHVTELAPALTVKPEDPRMAPTPLGFPKAELPRGRLMAEATIMRGERGEWASPRRSKPSVAR